MLALPRAGPTWHESRPIFCPESKCSRKSSNCCSLLAGAYETYEGSPVSKGQLQHDLWGVKAPSDRWDWQGLRDKIAAHGVRNSLLLAPMPTASTSQVLEVSCDSKT